MTQFLGKVRAFVQEFILGNEKTLDSTSSELPIHIYEAFKQKGLNEWWFPKQYGGLGISLEDSIEVVSELAYGDAGFALKCFIPIIASTAITLFGTDQQRHTYLKRVAGKSMIGATMASEQLAGSELLLISTTAEQQGKDYVINGNKYFSTNINVSDYCIAYVRMSGQEQDFKAIIVSKDAEGFNVVRRWPVIGLRSSGTYEINLKQCRVPVENALIGNGLRILEVALNPSRTLISVLAIGIAKRIRDLCLEYAKTKKIKDGFLITNDVFAAKIAEMEVNIDTMISLTKTAAREVDSIMSSSSPAQASLAKGILKSVLTAKIMCGKLGWQIASTASEMFGGFGYTEESLVGKLVRDIRNVAIIEGGHDVLCSLLYSRYINRDSYKPKL